MDFPISTSKRVTANTASSVNETIELRTQAAVWEAQAQGKEGINRRLAELDREWDIERCLETGAASLVTLGITLGKTVNPKWYALPAAVGGFLLQHALQGWCPPLPLLRRMGVRTADEINRERYALKLLRGDFAGLEKQESAIAVQETLLRTTNY